MKWFFGIILSLYLLFCGVLFTIQERIVFNPEVLPESHQFRSGQEVEIPLDEDLSMNAILIKASKSPSKKAILYFHGNRGSIRIGAYQIRQMRGLAYDILVPDYRGYGKTEGEPQNDKQVLSDAQKAFQYLANIYGSENIIVVGYSLGTGMASYVASQSTIKHLLMIAPFTSLTDIKDEYIWFTPDFLLKYRLNTERHLENVHCPITILHGTEDQVVKYKHAQSLKSKFGDKINLITRKGAGHRRIIFDSAISEVLKGI